MKKHTEGGIRGEKFSVRKRVQSFGPATRGIRLFVRNTHNAWLQILLCLLAIALGFYFHITKIDWMFIILSSGLVFTAEALNTALEIAVTLASPEIHPYARDGKDVAAGAVLISALIAGVIGLMIFVPYLTEYFS